MSAPSERDGVGAALVRRAGRALARHGLVHAYGHCSLRLDRDSFLVSPPRPLGLVDDGDAAEVVGLDGALPDGVLGEVRIHREIYRRRPDVHGVVRSMPRGVMALSALGRTPEARHGFGSYFAPRAPLWDDPRLLRDDARAAALAAALGPARAIVLRGNGAVTVGASLEEAAVLAFYLEDAARLELDVLATGLAGTGPSLTGEEVAERATWSGRLLERMWDYLEHGSPRPG